MSAQRPAAVLVLAAGEGTRMRSSVPKVLHAIGGRTLLAHAVAAAQGLEPEHLVVVVRHAREQVLAHVGDLAAASGRTIRTAEQDDLPGTGRAAACGLAALPPGAATSGTVVVTYGDVPLLTTATLAGLLADHEAAGSTVTVLTAQAADPTGYGRIVRDGAGAVVAIVEEADASDEQRAVTEVNSGIYAFDAAVLRAGLAQLGTDNAAGEAYLTDVVSWAVGAGHPVGALAVGDPVETEGVNDRVQLARLERLLRDRVVAGWQRAGVTVVDPATTWLDVEVLLEQDVTLLPGTQLLGRTSVAAAATVGPDTTLRDCTVGPGAVVRRTDGTGAVVEAGASVGPFSYLRPGTVLGADGKVGAFVETKNAVIGARSKVPHLSYVGDAEIGTGTNIGAASVFVNYDGVAKHRTVVGDHVRIGSDTMLVAPLRIGDGAYTAAGSVIDRDVPAGSLAVGRARQRTISGWVARRRAGSDSARAAAAADGTSAPHQPGTPASDEEQAQ